MQKASVCKFLFKINIKKMIDCFMAYHFSREFAFENWDNCQFTFWIMVMSRLRPFCKCALIFIRTGPVRRLQG